MSESEQKARSYLQDLKCPLGLQDCFIDCLRDLPVRFFILDDSGSMCISDGHKVVSHGNHVT